MPAPPDDARSFLGETLATLPCGDDGVLLQVRPDRELPPIRSSRFFMLRREDGIRYVESRCNDTDCHR